MLTGPAFYALAGRGVQYIAQFALVLLAPRLLLPEYFVQYSLLLPLAMLGATLIFGWFTSAAYRHAHAIIESEDGRDRRTAYFYYGAVSLSLVLVYGIAALFALPIHAVMILLAAASGLKNGILAILNSAERHRAFFLSNVGFAISLGVFLGLCAWLPDDALPWMLLAHAVLDVMVAVTGWCAVGVFSLRTSPRFYADVGRRYLRYGLPMLPNILAVWIVSLSDRYILAMWESTEQVASYILSYQLGGSIVTIPMAFVMAVLYPRILRIDREQGQAAALDYTYGLLKRYVRWIAVVSVAGSVALAFFIRAFYPAYEVDTLVIAVIVMAHAVFGLGHFFNKEFELNGRTLVVARSVGLGAVVNVVLNFALIPGLGALGAALATLAAYACSIYVVFKARTYVPVPDR